MEHYLKQLRLRASQPMRKLYPKLGKKADQLHHVFPKYLGGAKDGELAKIPAAYHQLITNEFRALAPYGQKIQRTAEEVERIYSRCTRNIRSLENAMTTSITAETEARRMSEYVNVRASETLGQAEELVSFLKSRFPDATKPIGRTLVQGTECVEVRVPSNSPEFEEIRRFIDARRKLGQRGFSDFTIGWYLRKYTKAELQNAEVLRLTIASHFDRPEKNAVRSTRLFAITATGAARFFGSDPRSSPRAPAQRHIGKHCLGGVGCLFKLRSNVHRKQSDRCGVPTDFRVQKPHQAVEGLVPTVGHRESGRAGGDY